MVMNSTLNDCYKFNEDIYNYNFNDQSIMQNMHVNQDSFTKSARTIINSIRTDRHSKVSECISKFGSKVNEMLENEELFEEKLHELDSKIHDLKNVLGLID